MTTHGSSYEDLATVYSSTKICPTVARALTLSFRLTGVVANIDDTTPDEPSHPSLVVILESGDDFARIVIPASVSPLKKRDLLAVDRPVAVAGESDFNPFGSEARAVATSLQLLDGSH